MKRFILFTLLLTSLHNLFAQHIEFKIQLQGQGLELNKEYTLNGTSITISTCKFYFSTLPIGLSKSAANYHLIDASSKKSLIIPTHEGQKEQFTCALGVDSIRSVSGVFGGALDPTNGMYWTWQSGYINIKIEGTSPQCSARKNKFLFHLGGYAYPYNTQRRINLNLKKEDDNYIILINLDHFFKAIDLSKDYQVMSPSKKAMKLSDLFANCFSSNEE